MPAAHICPTCGTDLATRPSAREPLYGLRVVRCGRCGRVICRGDQVRRLRRRLRRGGAALGLLAINGIGLLLLSLAAVAWIESIPDLRTLSNPHLFDRFDLVMLIAISVGLPVLIGAWLAAGLGHCRRTVAWIGFAIAIAAWLTLFASIDIAGDLIRQIDSDTLSWPGDELIRWAASLAWIVPFMAIALLGAPAGRLVRAILRATVRGLRRREWRRRRLEVTS